MQEANKTQRTLSCSFNSEGCGPGCSSYTICSLMNTEKHLNSLENNVSNIFASLNSLLEFSSSTGATMVEIKEILPEKEDIIVQFNSIYDQINSLRTLITEGNKQLEQLILGYSDQLQKVLKKMETLEQKLLLPEAKEKNKKCLK